MSRHVQEVWDIPGRILLLRLAFQGTQIVLGGVQLPTGGEGEETKRIKFQLFQQMRKWGKKPTIIMGDFNACLNPSIDSRLTREGREIPKYKTQPEPSILKELG